MSRLFLLRHARAAWAQPGMRDFDRPLDPEGRREAEAIGTAMLASGFIPEGTLCSSARRARETWDAVAKHVSSGSNGAIFTDTLYSADATGYLAVIRDSGDPQSLLVVGHNPMMEDLAFALAADGDGEARATLAHGFPVSGLAVIEFDGPLSDAKPRKGFLQAFLTP